MADGEPIAMPLPVNSVHIKLDYAWDGRYYKYDGHETIHLQGHQAVISYALLEYACSWCGTNGTVGMRRELESEPWKMAALFAVWEHGDNCFSTEIYPKDKGHEDWHIWQLVRHIPVKEQMVLVWKIIKNALRICWQNLKDLRIRKSA